MAGKDGQICLLIFSGMSYDFEVLHISILHLDFRKLA